MKKEGKNNLPIIVKNNKLPKSAKYKIYDILKATGKIVGGTAGFFGGFVVAGVIGGPIGGTLGFGIMAYNFVEVASNARFKTEPGLMFVSQKKMLKKETKIYQNSRINLTAKMRGYNQIEKAAMMTLQSLIGLSRYKDNLEGSSYYEKENGSKVYTKMFTTDTHSVNLKTFKKLADLGLIEIDPDYPDFKDTGKKSSLFLARIGFGRYKEAFKGLRDKTEMKEVRFRLTDKQIDFEDMYKKINGIIPYESQEERTALSRFGSIFRTKYGILSTKSLDIEKDVTGRIVLRYGRKKMNFGKRMEEKIKTEQKIKGKQEIEFDKRIKEGVTPEIIKKIESGELANQVESQKQKPKLEIDGEGR